jgi:hypothetical protein
VGQASNLEDQLKVDVCFTATCRWMGFRADGAPSPTSCPRCDALLPRVNARTGRWDPPAGRRIVAVDGDVDFGSWR